MSGEMSDKGAMAPIPGRRMSDRKTAKAERDLEVALAEMQERMDEQAAERAELGEAGLIERRAERRFTAMMAAAGVDTNRAATQLLYYLPDAFIRAYEELFMRALKIAGESTGADAGALGKAPSGTSDSKGKTSQLRGGAGKKYKEYWIVQDDGALELKGRVDKRLRSLAREIRDGLLEGDELTEDGKMVKASKILGKRCPNAGCSQLKDEDWSFCQNCGSKLVFLDPSREVR